MRQALPYLKACCHVIIKATLRRNCKKKKKKTVHSSLHSSGTLQDTGQLQVIILRFKKKLYINVASKMAAHPVIPVKTGPAVPEGKHQC